MRQKFFLGVLVFLAVMLLIIAFQNNQYGASLSILFWDFSMPSALIILFIGALGFLIGFFAMLYSFEVRAAKALADQQEIVGASSVEEVEPITTQEVLKEAEKNGQGDAEEPEPDVPVKANDRFEEDDEILG